jgi:hypothetical protein
MILSDAAVDAEPVIGECHCDTCGRTYDFERGRADVRFHETN